MLRQRVTAAMAVLVVALCPALVADNDIVAFGDSITEGGPPFDQQNLGGYPGRLQTILRDAGMSGVQVFNEGLSSEKTADGVTRIDSVLNRLGNRASLFIIMEGTNDVTKVAIGEISLESTMENLEIMAAKVRARGIDVLNATVIPRPPWAKRDRFNEITFDLVFRLRELSASGVRALAEPWAVFENQGADVFNTHYYRTDPVGHPNAAGFQLLAETFAEHVLGEDTLPPVVSGFSKTGNPTSLVAGDLLFALIHESGTGIRKADTFFTLNGRQVETVVDGSKRRLTLTYEVDDDDIACGGRVVVRSEDSAQPPNIRDRLMAELSVPDSQLLKGDVNADCRVDGFDLSLFGLSFGSRRGDLNYSNWADNNNDGEVDGDDLAKLARNFGKTSS